MKHILSKSKFAIAALIAGMVQLAPQTASAQSGNQYIGQIATFGYNFCPRDWAGAEGQLLPISSYTALFSILGTQFGGDGRTTFGLPDLRGRRAIGFGTGPGLNQVRIGQKAGAESFTLNVLNLPLHNHLVNASNDKANKNGPGTDFLAVPDLNTDIYHEGPATKQMDPGMISHTGGSQSVGKTSPSLGMYWCIALNGIYPSRS